MHVHNTVNVYMLTYCFTYVVLKLYVHHDNNVRLIYHCDDFYQIQPGKRSYMAPTLVLLYWGLELLGNQSSHCKPVLVTLLLIWLSRGYTSKIFNL